MSAKEVKILLEVLGDQNANITELKRQVKTLETLNGTEFKRYLNFVGEADKREKELKATIEDMRQMRSDLVTAALATQDKIEAEKNAEIANLKSKNQDLSQVIEEMRDQFEKEEQLRFFSNYLKIGSANFLVGVTVTLVIFWFFNWLGA